MGPIESRGCLRDPIGPSGWFDESYNGGERGDGSDGGDRSDEGDGVDGVDRRKRKRRRRRRRGRRRNCCGWTDGRESKALREVLKIYFLGPFWSVLAFFFSILELTKLFGVYFLIHLIHIPHKGCYFSVHPLRTCVSREANASQKTDRIFHSDINHRQVTSDDAVGEN